MPNQETCPICQMTMLPSETDGHDCKSNLQQQLSTARVLLREWKRQLIWPQDEDLILRIEAAMKGT